ncbi:hypothetical protein SAMN05428981_11039 [Bacillus sp. OV194]|nr:hypothetical protein SAMN05428981_11039 [Bacillus sp. OV194]
MDSYGNEQFTFSELVLIKESISKQADYYKDLVTQKQRVAFNARSEIAYTNLQNKLERIIDL